MMMMMLLLNVLMHKLGLLIGNVFLVIFGHMLLNVNMDGLLHWDFHGIRNVFLNLNWHFLDHGVGCGHMDLNFIRHWLVNMHWHGTIIGNVDGDRHLLDHWHWHWLVNIVGHWFVDMVGHWLLNGHFHRVVNDLLDGVGLVDVHVLLYFVVDNLFNGIRSWDMNFHGHMDLLLDWVRCWHMYLRIQKLDHDLGLLSKDKLYLYGHRTIVRHMNCHGNLLFDRIWRWNFIRHFHDLLNLIGHMLDDGIRLGYLDLDGHMDMFLDRHMDNFLDGHRNWHLFNDCQCLFLMHWKVWHMMMMIILIVMQSTFRLCGILTSSFLGLLLYRLSCCLLHSGTLLFLPLCIASSQQQHESERCRCTLEGVKKEFCYRR